MNLRRAGAAGFFAGLVLALAQGVLRLAGVPLPSELVADRLLPLLPVQAFIFLLGHLGGPTAAKGQALLGGFAGSVAAGVGAGLVYALLLRTSRPARHPVVTLAAALIVVWLGALAFFGPVLQASFAGLPPAAAVVVNAAALLAQFAAFALALLLAWRPLQPEAPVAPADIGRRGFVLGAVGLVMAIATGGLAGRFYQVSTLSYDGMSNPPPVDRLTPVDRFYVVTKNIIDPRVDRSLWQLDVGGMVANPTTYDFNRLAGLAGAFDQEVTLECISNEVGRGLISNAVWRGVRLWVLIEAARPRSDVVGVTARAVDGYTHTLSLDMAMDERTMVAWSINGQRLPDHHGFPARLIVPSAYGEVSVKWLTSIELVDHTEKGYYESQGWKATYVETTSRIEVPAAGDTLQSGRTVSMRGIAYAAERGISRVEVSTDGGSAWTQARLDSGSPATWYLWSLAWIPSGSGRRLLKVRAYDGGGKLQAESYRPSVPSGVTGEFTIPVTVAP